MSNEVLFFVSIIIYFSLMLTAYKFFGVTGLYLWTGIGMIISNIEVLKMVDMFGYTVTLGNVIYGSTFLATDIISEKHGKDEAKKTVYVGFFAVVTLVLVSQLIVAFKPSDIDFVQESFVTIFSFTPRLAIAGIGTYCISQMFDIWAFHKIKAKTGNSKLWLRNNGSTLISQFLDTIIFTLIAFYGVFEYNVVIELIFTSYVIKLLVSVLDTPFIYIAKNMKENILKF